MIPIYSRLMSSLYTHCLTTQLKRYFLLLSRYIAVNRCTGNGKDVGNKD